LGFGKRRSGRREHGGKSPDARAVVLNRLNDPARKIAAHLECQRQRTGSASRSRVEGPFREEVRAVENGAAHRRGLLTCNLVRGDGGRGSDVQRIARVGRVDEVGVGSNDRVRTSIIETGTARTRAGVRGGSLGGTATTHEQKYDQARRKGIPDGHELRRLGYTVVTGKPETIGFDDVR